ncbi:MAG: hydrogenase iron-sulfur subunit [Pseudomonadota bacterium]
MDKVGVFLCTGCEIGDCLDCDALEGVATEAGAKHFAQHACLCSDEGVATIKSAIDDGTVDGVIIAACSQRFKTEVFRFDPYKAVTQRCGLREQVTWSHPAAKKGDEEDDTQQLAADLVRMWTVRVTKEQLPKKLDLQLEHTVLVVGGGLTGLTAAKAATGLGHKVILVDKADHLGGYLTGVKNVIPEAPPYDSLHHNPIADLVKQVQADGNIQVFTSSTIKATNGQPGQFEVTLATPGGDKQLKAGSIVQATGSSPYDASKLGHLGYGASKDVITQAQLEKMLLEGKLFKPSDGTAPGRVLFVQCAGSRDEKHLPYCSGECCGTSLKQMLAVHEHSKDIECAIVYRDMRAPGQLEHFYKAVQEKTRGLFTRGVVDKVEGSGPLKVHVTDSLLGDDVTVDADLVVLATGMVPNAADGEAIRKLVDAHGRIVKNESETQVAAAKEEVERLKVHEGTEILNLGYRQGPDLPQLKYGFPDSHYICFPYETRRTGVFAAGTVRAPMDTAQAIEDGWGAALKAVQVVEAAERSEAVHPRSGDIGVADFFLQRCTQCKRCTEECPFGTINEDAKGTPQYNELRCRRCGICLGACPERIISFPDYAIDGISSMVKEMSVPEDFEEKPRILALMCENDALPALEDAAAKRMQWPPWFRIVPVRCLGSVNNIWLADSLSRGIDGVLMCGCKHGDDYQCHYVKGSELAETRMANLQETLGRLSLEPERIRIATIARNESARIVEVLNEFSESMESIGPNPMKGF